MRCATPSGFWIRRSRRGYSARPKSAGLRLFFGASWTRCSCERCSPMALRMGWRHWRADHSMCARIGCACRPCCLPTTWQSRHCGGKERKPAEDQWPQDTVGLDGYVVIDSKVRRIPRPVSSLRGKVAQAGIDIRTNPCGMHAGMVREAADAGRLQKPETYLALVAPESERSGAKSDAIRVI